MLTVSTNELRQITEILLDHLDATGKSVVDLQHDFYWAFTRDEKYDPYKQPSEMTIGQLTSDIAELRSILSGQKEPMALALVWLGAILQAIGEKVVS